MSGYLDRLAAVASGGMPVLTPRVPSRFESRGPTEPEWGEVDGGDGGDATSFAPLDATPPRPGPAVGPPVSQAPAPALGREATPPPWPDRAGAERPEPPAGRRSPPADPRVGDGVADPAPPTRPAPAIPRSSPASPAPAGAALPPAARTNLDRLLDLLDHLGEPVPRTAPRRDPSAAGDGDGRPGSGPPATPAPGQAPLVAGRPVSTSPAAGRFGRPDLPRPAGRRERHEVSPAVHVHIGRIEVRALPAPPPAVAWPDPRTAPDQDAVTGAPRLEEYLRDPRSRQ